MTAPAPDVAIIGGGIVGTAIAAELAGRGVSTTLYERDELAAGASGRNSGVVWYPSDPVLGAFYRESLERYRSLPDELAAALSPGAPDRGFRLGAQPSGILELGWDEDVLRAAAASAAATNPELGPSYVDQAALRRLEPALADGLAAVRFDIGFPVAPASATRALGSLARARGARIRLAADARVAREGASATGVVVDGRLEPAGAVVVAAGPWSPALIDPTGAWRPIRPLWGVIVELELGDRAPVHVLEETGVAAAIAPATPGGEDQGAWDFSLVTAGGRSSLGSTFLPAEPDPRAWEARLRERGARFVPAIAATPTRGLRACARPLAADGRPLVGAVPGIDRLFIAAGHGPWGISTGPASARHVADLVLGAPDPRDPAVRTATDSARFGAPPA
ncbi:MAG TPA: FAD-dependent oxidoreductase [Candidatus Limnocylindrales bacterium]|nr:FAD-dependent oxidoreductase [Candidatus Limnocylindrales bacterium]